MTRKKPAYEELESRCREMEVTLATLTEEQKHTQHIKQVLLAIRNVNQLIVAEDDPKRLIERACVNLTETLGYYNAWIALLNEDGTTASMTAASGFDGEFEIMRERLQQGVFSCCTQRALSEEGIVVIKDPPSECADCPLAPEYAGRSGFTRRLAYKERLYGILSVSVPGNYAHNGEEQDLFNELAGDLSFALHKIEAEKQIRRLNHIVATIPQPMALVSSDYRYLAANDFYSELYGVSREKILGRTVAEFCGEEVFNAEIKPHLDRCLSGQIVRYEVEVDFPGRGNRWMEMEYYPYSNEKGEITGVVSHGKDITERKQAEITLWEDEQKFRALFNEATNPILVVDQTGRYIDANNAALEFLECDRDELLSKQVWDFTVSEHLARQKEEHAPFVGRRTLETDYLVHGAIKTLLLNVVPLEIGGNTVLYGVGQDITERKRAVEALRESENRLTQIIYGSSIALFVIDDNHRITHWNKACEELTGLSSDKMRGTRNHWRAFYDRERPTMADVIMEDDSEKRIESYYLAKCRKSSLVEGAYEAEDFFPQLGERGKWLFFTATPLKDGRGRRIGAIETIQDITARKRREEELESARAFLDTVLDLSPFAMWVSDREGTIVRTNRALHEIINLPEERIVGKYNALSDKNLEVQGVMPRVRAVFEKREPTRFSMYWKAADAGEVDFDGARDMFIDVSMFPILNARGELTNVVCQWVDITERRRAEEALRTTLEQQEAVFESSMVGIMLLHNRIVTKVNHRMAEMLGYTPEEMEGRGPEQLHLSHEHFVEFGEKYYWQLAEKIVVQAEYPLRHKDGHTVWCLFSGRAIAPPDLGRGAVWIIDDITDRKRAEEALRESEQRYREIFEGSRDGYVMVDTSGRIVDANQSFCKMLGYSLEELREMEDFYRITPERWHKWEEEEIWEERLLKRGYSGVYEKEYIRKDGSVFPIELQSYTVFDREGNPQYLWGVVRDITERKQAEAALKEKEERLQYIVNVSTDLIYEWDVARDTFLWHGGFDEALGYEPGEIPRTIQGWVDLIHPEDAERLRDSVKLHRESTEPIRETYRARRKDGSWVWWEDFGTPILDETGRPVRWIGGCRDITRERTLEEQYRQAQKMEAIGQLTGGVAHDFNNLLQVINGATEMAMMDLEENHPASESLDEVSKAGARAAKLVSQLLMFSRRQIMRPEVIDLNDTVADLLKMLGRVIGEHIRLEWVPGQGIGTINADRGMIEQALMNLCVNSRDAMPEGGKLTIETQEIDIDKEYSATHSWARAGRYAVLSVTDTGCGMDRETLEHVFEPFFTTKETGKGTGLGLATVYGIVRQHEGMINAYSEPGRGTTMKLYFPLSEGVAEEEHTAEDTTEIGGTETILLAEDDEAVCNLGRSILERAGYTVVTAKNGAEAVEVFEELGDQIDLAILDVMMPEMSGKEAYEKMKAQRPSFKALFASGYSENAIHTNFILDKGVTLIQKPFATSALRKAVRQVLDRQ